MCNTTCICQAYVAYVLNVISFIGLFCRMSSLLWGSFAKETGNFKEPTNRSHPICATRLAYVRHTLHMCCICVHMFCILVHVFCILVRRFCILVHMFWILVHMFCILVHMFCILVHMCCILVNRFCILVNMFCIYYDLLYALNATHLVYW